MSDTIISQIVGRIESLASNRRRLLIAIAGPPGAGKSTISEMLVARLNDGPSDQAALVQMDGYHYDNRLLEKLGLLATKGAPDTFNAGGLLGDMKLIKAGNLDVAIPVFDRAADLARANAAIVSAENRFIVVEGNYLLLDRPIWREIAGLFDLTVMVSADEKELERRLIDRWLKHGLEPTSARQRARRNDLANAKVVISESQTADLSIQNM